MIKDPAVQAIVNGGTSRFLTRRQRVERVILWALVVAVIALGGGYLVVNGVAHKAQSASDRANAASAQANAAALKAAAGIQSSCQFWHDLSQVPLSTSSSPALLTIIRDSRIAYSGLECTPDLPTADPRVAALLPPGVH